MDREAVMNNESLLRLFLCVVQNNLHFVNATRYSPLVRTYLPQYILPT